MLGRENVVHSYTHFEVWTMIFNFVREKQSGYF